MQEDSEGSGQEEENVSQELSTQDKEDLSKYGVYYYDDYNYLQHLKTVGEDPSGVVLSVHGDKEPEKGICFRDESDANALDSITGNGSKKNLSFPSEVFPSAEEMDVGLMNQPETLGNLEKFGTSH